LSEHDAPTAAPWRADAPAPPAPLPFLHGRYDVSPGMTRLAAPAAPASNAGFFVLGPDARAYLDEKLRVLRASADAHRGAVPDADADAVGRVLWATLLALGAEHPSWLSPEPDGALAARALGLRYALRDAARAGEGVRVRRVADAAAGWEEPSAGIERWLAAGAGLAQLADAVALSMQEDWAVVRASEAPGGDAVEALHVCFPSHWDPRAKLGDHFAGVHGPVASNAVLLSAHHNIVRAMVGKGPFLRHAWGIARDARLDHHPEADGGGAPLHAPAAGAPEPAYLRVERQTTRGFPEMGRALFTIRTYVVPLTALARREPAAARALASALRGMDEGERRYKGLAADADALARWLDGPGAGGGAPA
jgi:hypothetical protein